MKAKDTTNIWLDIGKAAEVLGLSVQTVKNNVAKALLCLKLSSEASSRIILFT